jgi:hypothetical protein
MSAPTAPSGPMRTRSGLMQTGRAERYARQLASHWSKRTIGLTDNTGTLVLRLDTGNVLVMRPLPTQLLLQVSVPPTGDLDRFAEVVKDHLERFAQREKLQVTWQ